jgi:branched-chain amino acid transport system permease protein
MEEKKDAPTRARKRLGTYQMAQIVLGVLFLIFLAWRLYTVLVVKAIYGPDTWVKFVISGLIIGSVYALIAIGYTLVYGILRMINFAHSEVFMAGTFGGYFVFEGLGAWIVDPVNKTSFMNTYPIPSIILAFLAGIGASMLVGFGLERIAYRPLRKAPRLVPLISAIGASIFLQNAAQLIFGPQQRSYQNPEILDRTLGWTLTINDHPVPITYTGIFTVILTIVLLLVLYNFVQRTRLGRAMRAVSEDTQTASLMGIDVDHVISQTFLIAGAWAGAAGVMWGIHYAQIGFYVGFLPGIKAFTAAVLGGIGSLPGATLGGLVIGLIESLGPAALGIDFQLKDVIAFSILVLVLIFRPSGILGEALSEEKV